MITIAVVKYKDTDGQWYKLTGAKGADGLSPYEAAKLEGFIGTKEEFYDQLVNAVPKSRTVNGKPLVSDIALTAQDVGADPEGSASAIGVELAEAVANIDSQLNIKANQSEFASHLGDNSVHVTDVEKDKWNSAGKTITSTCELSASAWEKDATHDIWTQAVTIAELTANMRISLGLTETQQSDFMENGITMRIDNDPPKAVSFWDKPSTDLTVTVYLSEVQV